MRVKADKANSDECYTPAEYLQLARDVLREIDCDPASNEAANRVVRASVFYTKADNGLVKPWVGRLWLNCPYSRPRPWAERLIAAYNSGAVSAAVAVFNANLASRWFHPLAEQAWRCEPFKRIAFWGPGTIGGTGWSASCFFYLGPEPQRFAAVFSAIGRIVPPAAVTQGVTASRFCSVCTRPLPVGWRADADTCSSKCRQRKYRRKVAA